MNHELKTDHEVFQAVWDGDKRYEIRFDDRNFQDGEDIHLRETVHTGEEMKAGKPLDYTGRYIRAIIIHKLSGKYGIEAGWCILGLELKTRLEIKTMTVCKWTGEEWEEVAQ